MARTGDPNQRDIPHLRTFCPGYKLGELPRAGWQGSDISLQVVSNYILHHSFMFPFYYYYVIIYHYYILLCFNY